MTKSTIVFAALTALALSTLLAIAEEPRAQTIEALPLPLADFDATD